MGIQELIPLAPLSSSEKATSLGPWVDVKVGGSLKPYANAGWRALELSLLLTSTSLQRALLLGHEDVSGSGPSARAVGATFRRKYVERFRATLARLCLAGVDFELEYADEDAQRCRPGAVTYDLRRILVIKSVTCQAHFDCRRFGAGIGAACYRANWTPRSYVKAIWPLTRPVGGTLSYTSKVLCRLCGTCAEGPCSAVASEIGDKGEPAGIAHFTPAFTEKLALSWGLTPTEDVFRRSNRAHMRALRDGSVVEVPRTRPPRTRDVL